jgi:hypothetical protein
MFWNKTTRLSYMKLGFTYAKMALKVTLQTLEPACRLYAGDDVHMSQ